MNRFLGLVASALAAASSTVAPPRRIGGKPTGYYRWGTRSHCVKCDKWFAGKTAIKQHMRDKHQDGRVR